MRSSVDGVRFRLFPAGRPAERAVVAWRTFAGENMFRSLTNQHVENHNPREVLLLSAHT